MKRKYPKIDIDIHPQKDYPWICTCGGHGFTLISEQDYGETARKNPTPCQKCLAEIQLKKGDKK